MNRDIAPADLLPAIANVAGGLIVSLVLAEAARTAAEHELAAAHGASAAHVPHDRQAAAAANGFHAADMGPRTPAGESRLP